MTIAEIVFSFPGLGSTLLDALLANNTDLLVASVFILLCVNAIVAFLVKSFLFLLYPRWYEKALYSLQGRVPHHPGFAACPGLAAAGVAADAPGQDIRGCSAFLFQATRHHPWGQRRHRDAHHVPLGYASVLSQPFGRTAANVLKAVESVPSILIALFCYAPVSVFLARNSSGASQVASLSVFILAAALTTLPEAVRSIAIPLGDLYHRKYSLSFRSYGLSKGRILAVLMKSHSMRAAVKRAAAGASSKTLVLDCSFGFIIQLGFGS